MDPRVGTSVRLIADYGRIDEVCCAAVNVLRSDATLAIKALGGQVSDPADRFDNVIYTNYPSVNEIDNYGFSGEVSHDLGGFKLTSITAWRKSDAFTNQDSDFTSAMILQRNSQDLNIGTMTQELRLNAKVGDNLTVLLGGYYFHEKIRQANRVQ